MPRFAENTGDQQRRRRFAVRTGDTNNFQSLARVAMNPLAQLAERLSAVSYQTQGRAVSRNVAFSHNRRAAAGNRIGHIIVAIVVGAHSSDEDIAGADAPRI